MTEMQLPYLLLKMNAISDPRNATSVTPLVLSDDLQRVHDNLSASSLAVREETRIYRRLGSSMIELMANTVVTCLTIGLLVISKNENYNLISYAITYFIQELDVH
ncbi:hypothetical protein RIR_jg36981.t1 [Rhizophagus irregularis DAOM 181602=DAOM 197198]|nr:hypothetical protein RIR_jg36981.t1 [Rhizophagus irregularis DAOM 181602=DAOM 197198]